MSQEEFQLYALCVWIGGLLVSIAGVVLVTKQVQLVNRQLEQVSHTISGNAFSSSFAELREIHKVFIDHPHLRPYFYDDKRLPENSEYWNTALTIAEMFLDAFFHLYLLRDRFPDGSKKHVDLFIEDMVQRSPFLAEYLEKNAQFMQQDLQSLVLKLIEARKRRTGGQE